MVPLPGLAEEHGLNGAAGTQGFFDEADAFNADEAVFRWQAAAESYTELFEPAIFTAGQKHRFACGARVPGGFSWRGHYRERSKLLAGDANSEVRLLRIRLRMRTFC